MIFYFVLLLLCFVLLLMLMMKMQILCHLAVAHALDDDDCALFLL